MRIYNAGLDKVEFGYNSSAGLDPRRGVKEGGYYSILPGESIEVPEGAKELIENPLCGPGLRGVVILDFGMDFNEAKINGLSNYINYLKVAHERVHQRQVELEQVGVKNYSVPKEMDALDKKIKESESILLKLISDSEKEAEEAMIMKELEQENGDTSADGSEGKEKSGGSNRGKSSKVQPAANL